MGKIKIGSIVKPKRTSSYRLVCGSGRYQDAVVVSLKPFVLVSREGDMRWSATVRQRYFRVCGKANSMVLKVCKARFAFDLSRGIIPSPKQKQPDGTLIELRLDVGHTIMGYVSNPEFTGQLSAMFQVWARNHFGITDSESFCMVISKQHQQESIHYKNWFTSEEFDAHRASGLAKIDWSKLPDTFA